MEHCLVLKVVWWRTGHLMTLDAAVRARHRCRLCLMLLGHFTGFYQVEPC